ncbi:UDP-N-acetylmuramate--L-alanine ligase [Candidatus Kaiserbacteria bacterium]|nr:UDP-N-acetylmuramate--L-alanine ligase [Candidatus Kaiserbacteria bacterium]
MEKIKHIHFIGIGGIGMSALARFYLHEGVRVSGSDRAPSDITRALEKEGVTFFDSQVASNLSEDIDMVVYTEAMASDHPELLAAREGGIKTVNYFEALGEVANQYYLIAVAGAHGKTTTTAMITDILEEASYDPTAIIGSLRSKTGSNFRAGKSKYAVVEACEYKRDFLSLKPDVLVITNIEHEHVDYYKDLLDVQTAFRTFAEQVDEEGLVIANVSDPNLQYVLNGLDRKVVDYKNFIDLSLKLRQPGMHVRLDAAAAVAAAASVGVEEHIIKTALENFAGTWRRFQYKGEVNNAPVYDDYAHHPTEIAVTIAGVRELYPDKKLIVVFQPHTYTRTKELFNDFVTALSKADLVVMVPIYAAREVNLSGVSSEQIIKAVAKNDIKAIHFHTLAAAADYVKDEADKDSVVVVMGAGEVTNVASQLVE